MTEIKQLRRSRTDRKIAGVLGGIANYLNVDATAIRVLYVLFVIITGGAGLIAYPVLWLIMPEEPEPGWPTTPVAESGPPATQQPAAKPPASNPPAE